MRRNRLYKTVADTGVILICAAFLISPVYAASIQAFKYVREIGQDQPAASDTKYIQWLIDKTKPEGVCRIPEGEYAVAGLCVARPVKLFGAGNVTLRYYNGSGRINKPIEQSYTAAVWSGGVTFDGIKFINSDTAASAGILHLLGDHLEIRNNTFDVGNNCAGIISLAPVTECVVENNAFRAGPGMRAFPMIQFGKDANGAKIVNNTLNGDAPDMLTSEFLANFLSVESENAAIANNEFVYTGPINEEDLGGFEDSEESITREAFADLTKARVSGINPWTRASGDNNNPETRDGFSPALFGILSAAQAALGLAYMVVRRRIKSP